jgi:multicomponent Na+:H+ antiporter subunit C
MDLISVIIVAVLFSTGFYLMLQKHLFAVLIGLALISHGAIVVIIASSGYNHSASPPLLTEEQIVSVEAPQGSESGEEKAKVSRVDAEGFVDPLPQALILTAIVISFGLLSFFMVLVARVKETTGSMSSSEDSDPSDSDVKGAASS